MLPPCLTIKGLGKIFTAAILAGTGDLRQYAHGRQVMRKAGLNLAESSSGRRKGQIVLSKRGDSALRKYLYLATVQLVWNKSNEAAGQRQQLFLSLNTKALQL
ncbi:transposase [Paenibacillus glycanilyticus]|uniref:transposase n=1 Tax=Paenibacillus glycanilyticus TaxID=126569 RepID=UPI00203E344D|nr:transposase [Paenibacillus glycanilyticus]MCM3631665.1 transposase [Paenibacillus glycanilyticus]